MSINGSVAIETLGKKRDSQSAGLCTEGLSAGNPGSKARRTTESGGRRSDQDAGPVPQLAHHLAPRWSLQRVFTKVPDRLDASMQ